LWRSIRAARCNRYTVQLLHGVLDADGWRLTAGGWRLAADGWRLAAGG
jgi:hypothetical protein